MYLKGKNLIISANGTVVAAAKTCRISTDADMEEVKMPGGGRFRKYRPGRREWSVSVGTLLKSVYRGFLQHGSTVQLSFYVDGSQSDRMSGTAIVQKVEVTASRGRLAQGSFLFRGSGTLEYL